MAISHVWSDGTGTGAWPKKGVNRCLWLFFRDIARRFQVKGIWKFYWDEEDPRKAAKTASLAIIMSPWFSRGWTALELAKSRKVKILFKGNSGFVVKDPDNDILAITDSPGTVHYTATQAIIHLRRRKVTNMDDLLTVLGPRYTSWSRDMAIIAGLLVGIEIADADSQQGIYQNILRKIGSLCHEHLFHNSARMSRGFSWSPANILNIPRALSRPRLHIEADGNVVGEWQAFHLNTIKRDAFVWFGMHPMTEVYLRAALNYPLKHVFLIEPGSKSISKALLVRVIGKISPLSRLSCHLVGFLQFHPAQRPKMDDLMDVEISLGETVVSDETAGDAWDVIRVIAMEQKRSKNYPITLASRINKLENKNVAKNADIGIHHSKQTEPKNTASSESSSWFPLHLAADNGDENEVKRLLEEGADVNAQDKYSWTALHRAVWRCNGAVVNALMSLKANPTLEDEIGQTPLHLAAERGHMSILQALLCSDHRMDFQCKFDGQTLLHRGPWSGSRAVIDLLGKCSPLDTKDTVGRTALHIAADLSYEYVVDLLISWGADVNIVDKHGRTALSYAARNGEVTVLRVLLKQQSIKINISDEFGRTPLSLAAWHGHEGATRTLLQYPDTEVDLTDHLGRPPLFHATLHGHNRVIKLLSGHINSSVGDERDWLLFSRRLAEDGFEAAMNVLLDQSCIKEVKSHDQTKTSYLQMAAEHGNLALAEFLPEHGVPAQPEGISDTDVAPLSLAAANGHGDVFKLLLETEEIPINYYSEHSSPVLLRAAYHGNNKLIKLLIETREINVQLRDEFGMTAFLYACEAGHEMVVKQLLATGKIELNGPQKQGEKALYFAAWNAETELALSYAAKQGHENVVQMLLEAGKVDINCMSKYLKTPLCYAAESGHYAACKLLLDSGRARINTRDTFGRSPFMGAVSSGKHTVVKLFLETGKINNIEEVDQNGRTTLSLAAESGSEAIMKDLFAVGQPIDIDRPDKFGRAPISYAVERNHEAIIRKLLETGRSIDLNRPDDIGNTPLISGARKGYEMIWQILLKSGNPVDISHCNHHGQNLIFGAAILSSEKVM
ncbi:MAG: hypothetical protein Q9160_008750 [Pyrenula sp. 1 TL-2023]